MNREPVGYVVVVWNQASGQPSVVLNSDTDNLGVATADAVAERARTARVGRRERYAVAEVIPIEGPS